jgi:hypothetical protein
VGELAEKIDAEFEARGLTRQAFCSQRGLSVTHWTNPGAMGMMVAFPSRSYDSGCVCIFLKGRVWVRRLAVRCCWLSYEAECLAFDPARRIYVAAGGN